MKQILLITTITGLLSLSVSPAQAQGDAKRGEEAIRQCLACHSLEPGLHLTGPSLVGIVGRSAGKIPDFKRYSTALANADFAWSRETLDQWLENSEKLVPGTIMRIRPVTDAGMRQDIIAFLENYESPESTDKNESRMPDLKQAPPGRQVTEISYCPDAYRVTVATGAAYTLWEFNLRFKSDSSSRGPREGQPVLVGQGMRGDRAQVVFASPEEISDFIRKECSEK
jgi:cytochrome c